MPMKYSTLRSNTWRPSRWPRMAEFVSGVIQLRRPISSSAPQGLFDTSRPSCEWSFSGTSSGSAIARASFSVRGFRASLLRHSFAESHNQPMSDAPERARRAARRDRCEPRDVALRPPRGAGVRRRRGGARAGRRIAPGRALGAPSESAGRSRGRNAAGRSSRTTAPRRTTTQRSTRCSRRTAGSLPRS